ncbi:hypothetical protein RJ639_046692 [Escallonia herrerae]|uniref:F-ATPase gamma subunit n=1 Tax=Escallonia herrerae TaxID=1293975 RepID=A0AA89B1G4_9ASTE|nr:hypothetical protein RJ639_046692 [Escallonia herrerae]
MKLAADAKVRRALEAVISGRPLLEFLIEVLYSINEQFQSEDVDVPLTSIRPVKKVALVVITGDRLASAAVLTRLFYGKWRPDRGIEGSWAELHCDQCKQKGLVKKSSGRRTAVNGRKNYALCQ